MRLSITPIGATAQTAGGVARAVVDYLEGGVADPAAVLLVHANDRAVAYYADSPEGPGQWVGRGAAALGLTGAVEREAFASVLAGRDPTTGARLLGAQGSTRRAHLAVGAGEQHDRTGGWLYTIADVAKLLGVTKADVAGWVNHGDRLAGRGDPNLFGWIHAPRQADGRRLIGEREISRVEQLLAKPVTAGEMLAAGDGNDWLSVDDAAQLLRVSARYVRRLCATFERHRTDTGLTRPVTMLPCERARPGGPFLIRRDDLAAFAVQRKPAVARVGFDVTLTIEKSIAVLTMLTTGERQAAFLHALRVANQTAVDHLDRHGAVTRVRRTVVPTSGLVVAAYLHATSRTLDPHPHIHNIVANTVTTVDGQRRTLDARALYRHAPAAAALATAAARWELRHLGLGWRQRDDAIWEIDGVNDAAITEFSRRHHDIDSIKTALAEHLTIDAAHLDTSVWAQTRPDKQPVDPGMLLTEWHQRAARVGLDRHALDACFAPAVTPLVYQRLPDHHLERLTDTLIGPDGVTNEESMFTRADVLRAITDWAIEINGQPRRKVLLPPTEIERLTDQFLTGPHVVQLHLDNHARRKRSIVGDEPVYATVTMLQLQADIVNRYDNGQANHRAIVAPIALDKALTAHETLTDEQRALITMWCSSGDAIQTAVGRAGTGKTTTMRAAVEAWHTGGYRVLGAAVKGEAARQLANDAGIDADTVALLLTRLRRGDHHLDARTIVIVDEASTIGDRDLHELLVAADQAGAAVRLIGDPAQHSAVPAGGSYRALLNHDPERVPQLTRVFRLEQPTERHSAELVRTGRVTHALDHLHATGQLHVETDESVTYAAMIDRWYTLRRQGLAHPMVHQRNQVRHLLNTIAQQLLTLDHTLNPNVAVTLANGRRLCLGDQIITRRGNRRLHPDGHPEHWLRNGTHATITAITQGTTTADDTLTLTTSHGNVAVGRFDFDRNRGGLELAYAVTSYAIQGTTQPASTSTITPSSDRAETYVDITRGQHTNQLYATITPVGDTTEPHLPRAPVDLDEQLDHVLRRTPHPTAHHADPTALQRAHQGHATRTGISRAR